MPSRMGTRRQLLQMKTFHLGTINQRVSWLFFPPPHQQNATKTSFPFCFRSHGNDNKIVHDHAGTKYPPPVLNSMHPREQNHWPPPPTPSRPTQRKSVDKSIPIFSGTCGEGWFNTELMSGGGALNDHRVMRKNIQKWRGEDSPRSPIPAHPLSAKASNREGHISEPGAHTLS